MAAKRSTQKPHGASPKGSARGSAAHAAPDVERLRRVLEVMAAAGAAEVELEEGGRRLRVRMREDRPGTSVVAVTPIAAAAAPAKALETASPAAGEPAVQGIGASADSGGQVFKSPMVGTFYRSASPDSEPFVKEGDVVTPDTVLCIIEAMKVMNEIKAEMEGRIAEVFAQNGEPVDYGQPLFAIKP